MADNIELDQRFLEPFESVAMALEFAQVPLLVMPAHDHAAFVDQVTAVIGGTTLYSSQTDFIEQMLASLTTFDYLFSIIDEPLGANPYHLIRAYLAARDIMGADASLLATQFAAAPPHTQHRLVLIIDREVFERHNSHQRRELAELCTVIAGS